jgi:hypothetical protein
MGRSSMKILARAFYGRSRELSPEQRQRQSELGRKIIKRGQLWLRGRIGRVEDQIQTALTMADGEPVTTADLVRWVYYDVRWSIARLCRVEAAAFDDAAEGRLGAGGMDQTQDPSLAAKADQGGGSHVREMRWAVQGQWPRHAVGIAGQRSLLFPSPG